MERISLEQIYKLHSKAAKIANCRECYKRSCNNQDTCKRFMSAFDKVFNKEEPHAEN